MRIQVFEPFSLGLRRMNNVLIRNFDLRKWLVVGFTVFLAGLIDFNRGGSGMNFRNDSINWQDKGWWDVWQFPDMAWNWLMNNMIWFFLGAIIFILIIALGLVLLWLSSRGHFMFLYNVVEDKAEIGIPWKRFRFLGNSLFIFRTLVTLIASFIFLIGFIIEFIVLYNIYDSNGDTNGSFWLALGLGILVFLFLVLIFVCIEMFINDFLVQIMYKSDVGAFEGVRRLITLVSNHLGSFILYTLLKFGLSIAVVFVVMIIGFLTCCIGFFILAIPYISDVILLPISYTFRCFSVEFLEQFGSEYKLFPPVVSETGYNNF